MSIYFIPVTIFTYSQKVAFQIDLSLWPMAKSINSMLNLSLWARNLTYFGQ
ncbi:hypothetical protein AM1_4419 [Acaryochloris marina MBIC11017]|uniref:Uncharacterized protein n=1 Tax=Acaryochloris marina (strain MBIC 11017) TaxID=329726 RepID=B0CEZ9_ACAM1|nr:hypothetical protein AM1_4419 [Acaryochloris marina MBIC11017]